MLNDKPTGRVLHFFLSKRGGLAAPQGGHGSKLSLASPILAFAADARPKYCADAAAPVGLLSVFLVALPLRRRLRAFQSPSPFPRLRPPRPLPVLRCRHRCLHRRHRCRLPGSRPPALTGFGSRSFSPPSFAVPIRFLSSSFVSHLPSFPPPLLFSVLLRFGGVGRPPPAASLCARSNPSVLPCRSSSKPSSSVLLA